MTLLDENAFFFSVFAVAAWHMKDGPSPKEKRKIVSRDYCASNLNRTVSSVGRSWAAASFRANGDVTTAVARHVLVLLQLILHLNTTW